MKGNYTKLFVCAFIAAGVICLAIGLIVYFTAAGGGMQRLIGITVTLVGAADTAISVVVMLAVILKDRIAQSAREQETKDKKD